jgi:16S rRNA (adenine1518-N6/adenine1519-N6)-dimethyltransferase
MSNPSARKLNNGLNHTPRKRFGQNFLHDQGIIQRIIDEVAPQPGQHLLEIGPGQGALTGHLAGVGTRLDCIELDRDLAQFLVGRHANDTHVTIHQQDILKFPIESLEPTPHSLRVIGNLPYNISTPVLFHLLRHHASIDDMVFMLQLEVVQRMAAGVGDKNYGRLGLMLQYFCEIEHLFNVPSAAFTPQPKVSSAIVRLRPHRVMPLQARSVDTLQTVIRTAFNQRRKTLRNSLKTLVSDALFATLPIDVSQRPENLSLADYVLVSDAIYDEAQR